VAVAVLVLGLVLYNATLVDRRAPGIARVTLSAPAGDDRVGQSQTAIDIEFSEPVRTATVEQRFRIDPYVAGGFTWDGTIAIFTPSTKLPADTEFTVSVEPGFEDLVGNVAATGLDAWTFRTVGPPTVADVVPADGTQGMGVDDPLTIRFDRLMDTGSVESAIHVDPPVSLRPAWSGDSLRLTFEPALRFGTTYTLTIGTAAVDTGGTHLREPFITRFSTVAAGLTVLGTIPRDGVAGVSVRTSIAIRFDAPIDPATAADAIRVTPAVTGDVRVVSVPDDLTAPGLPTARPESANVLVFTPSGPLAANTTYSITLGSVVARRSDPGQVAAGRTWKFTTGAPSSSGQNQVAYLSARSGVRNVWLMNPDGTNQRQLTTEFVPVSAFDATADGRTIAYSAGGVVSLASVDGGNTRRLTADGTFEYAPRFTPDGRSLLVGRRGGDGTDLGYWLVPLPGTDGSTRQVAASGAPALGSAAIAGDGFPGGGGTDGWNPRSAFDPTGRYLLLVTSGGVVALIDLQAGAGASPPPPVPREMSSDAAAAWSPTAGAFLVAGRDASGAAVRAITPDGSVTQLPGTDGATGVAIAPTGMAVATLRAPGAAHASLLVLPADGPPRPLPGTEGLDERWPDFSPDAASIVVGRASSDDPTLGGGIWLIDPSTGGAVQLSTDGAYARFIP
jgi:hypothetical protein